MTQDDRRRRSAEDDPDDLYNDSVLDEDISQTTVDIDEFLTQKVSKHKRRKASRGLMTQAATQMSADELAEMKVAGVIKRVTLKNFMCHANFELDFGKRLNFIIGHNGSGKSSILTAISICLGAKATETNRGNSLKSLIQEGKNVAEVCVYLSNEGDEAFEPGLYGKTIIIKRTLRRDSTSGAPYVLMSENGRKVSNKKSDLEAILDYFNIAVSNPMCFLSQDMARSFLTASTDEKKFAYFMKGTLMEEMLANFKSTKETIEKVDDKLMRMKEAVVDLREEAKAARKLLEKLNDSHDLRDRQRILHGKYFWMEHDNAKKIIEDIKNGQAEQESVIEELDERIRDIEDKIVESERRRTYLTKKQQELTDEMNNIKAEHAAKKQEFRQAAQKTEKIVQKLENVQNEVEGYKRGIQQLDRAIEAEIEELKRKSGGSRDVLEQQHADLTAELETVEQELRSLSAQSTSVEEKYKPELGQIGADADSMRQQIVNLEQYIRRAKNVKKSDPLLPYSENIKGAVTDIKRSQNQFTSSVLGPLGRHVFLKPEFSDFTALIDAHLGNNLNTFVVHNHRDHQILKQIFRKNSCRSNILIRRPEKFNYENGMPSQQFRCLLDALEFDNEEAKYALIDSMHIESVVLEHDRREGQKILESRAKNVTVVIALNSPSSGFALRFSANNAFISNPIYYNTSSAPKIQSKGAVNDTRAQEQQLQRLNYEFEQLSNRKAQLHSDMKREKSEIQSRIKDVQRQKQKIKSQIYQLEKKLAEDVDTGKLEALKEDKATKERNLHAYNVSIPDLQQQVARYEEMASYLGEELETIKAKAMGQKEIIDNCNAQLVEADTEVQLNESKREHFHKSKKKRLQEIATLVENLPAWEQKVAETMEEGAKLCTQAEADQIRVKSTDHLRKEIETVTRKVQETDELLGKSPEDIVRDDMVARQKYTDAFTQFTEAKDTKALLSASLDKRLKAFRVSRETTCMDADVDFKDSLQFRNFGGKLDFDFKKQKLKMLVRTKNDKKPRHVDSLSGGEKSFSQISLLLATWKPMRSRIKGLDEFDVFMDQVNRKIGMRLMLAKLSAEPKSQTIFITPQDIGQIAELDPKFVKIHRIKDPRARD